MDNDRTEYETGSITTKDVMDAIQKNDLDRARDATTTILYKKTGEHLQNKKMEIANSIGKPDYTNDAVPVDFEPPTTEPEQG
jgi:hypothetical protein